MIKVAALYGHPANPEAFFEAYYAVTHMLLVETSKQLVRSETTKFLPDPDGSPQRFTGWADYISTLVKNCNRH